MHREHQSHSSTRASSLAASQASLWYSSTCREGLMARCGLYRKLLCTHAACWHDQQGVRSWSGWLAGAPNESPWQQLRRFIHSGVGHLHVHTCRRPSFDGRP